jgi:hypothetical protein
MALGVSGSIAQAPDRWVAELLGKRAWIGRRWVGLCEAFDWRGAYDALLMMWMGYGMLGARIGLW